MNEWSDTRAINGALPTAATVALRDRGFVVTPMFSASGMQELTDAYTAAMASAIGDDLRVGSTTTRLKDLVNRGPAFGTIYVFPPLLDACRQVIGRPFKLSSLHARTLRPHTPAEELHVDVPRGSADWPLLGFIVMVDEFRADNGATRFVPRSHRWRQSLADTVADPRAPYDGETLAHGAAGSLLIFNGSVWHGHTANTSSAPRRSIQGAFIPRTGNAAIDFAARMPSDTRRRLGPLARHVLAL